MKTLAIVNQKGGVGKTTTAINFADSLRKMKKKVLFVDMDPQHSASTTYRAQIDGSTTIYDVLKGESEVKEAIQKTGMGDIIAGDILLLELEPALLTQVGSEFFLREKLEEVEEKYDFCVVDTPPNPGRYTAMALVAADACVIPLMPGKYAVNGLAQITKTIQSVQRRVNKELKNLGVLIVRFDKRKKEDREISEQLPELAKQNGYSVFKTLVRVSQDVETAQRHDTSLLEKYPDSNGAKDYIDATKEMIKKLKEAK